ncbi:hypothetical protein [Curtobacterium sp. MCPF17_031]|uniref:hypothetical protein n=1 Tax=Curtobacterium sp. MCPF17_031 TaxID=2175653 RepID=UPI000DAA15BA|nr:hypothetical protein [Curtobacterium sp. MCPF17_031]PZE35775.1 hypothetical protein DEJ31_11530 [Curtobacterium sp. MCPF17_031]
MKRRVPAAVAVVTAGLLTLSACSAGGSTRVSAADAAVDFTSALADHRGDRACRLLVPDARDAVESETHRDCAGGVLELDLPTRGAAHTEVVTQTEVSGRAAIVRGDGDGSALFLARSGSSWLVRAAGCTAVADAPFDCVLDGS